MEVEIRGAFLWREVCERRGQDVVAVVQDVDVIGARCDISRKKEQREVQGSKNSAATALVLACLDLQRDAGGFGKGLVDATVLHGGAFWNSVSQYRANDQYRSPTQVSKCLDLLCNPKALFVIDTGLLGLIVLRIIVVFFPEIALQRDKDELDAWAVLCDLANPFRLYVLKRVWGVYREAEHDGVRIIVAE